MLGVPLNAGFYDTTYSIGANIGDIQDANCFFNCCLEIAVDVLKSITEVVVGMEGSPKDGILGEWCSCQRKFVCTGWSCSVVLAGWCDGNVVHFCGLCLML